MIRVVFFGSDEYSLIVLKSLFRNKRFSLKAIVTLPTAKAIREFGQKKKIPQIKTKTGSLIEGLKKIEPDIGILASFGKIIPPEILNLPKHGILNIHPSLLPRYRGPTPVPTAILNDEKETGVSIIKMDEEIDHGPIVAQFKEEIGPKETADDLLKRLFSAGAEVLKTILPAYLEGRIEPLEQNHLKATYTQKFKRDDGKIDWKRPADYNERFIRAMYPWPVAWTEIKVKRNTQYVIRRLKILKAHIKRKSSHVSRLTSLVLDQVQLEGKKPVTWKQFKEGYPKAKFTS